MSKYCPKCLKEFDDTALFCGLCGTDLIEKKIEKSDTVIDAKVEEVPVQTKSRAPQKKYLVLAIVSVVVVVAIAVSLIGKNDTAPNTNQYTGENSTVNTPQSSVAENSQNEDKESADNQEVIDTTAVLEIDTFEQLVDLGQHPNYDETFFAMFFDETFGETGNYEWTYIGTSYSTFELPEYDFYSFDVYKVSCPDIKNRYFLVPFNDYVGTAPNVYEFTENAELILSWIRQF